MFAPLFVFFYYLYYKDRNKTFLNTWEGFPNNAQHRNSKLRCVSLPGIGMPKTQDPASYVMFLKPKDLKICV